MSDVQLILGDCLEVLPTLDVGSIDAVVTDPPYPDYYTELYQQTPITWLTEVGCKQLIFWTAKVDFPLDYSAIHIWDKWIGSGSMYERIFERNGGKAYRIFKYAAVGNEYRAKIARDVHTGHPSQKPILLMRHLIQTFTNPGDTVADFFMGSGTTGVACVQTGRNFIGIEINPHDFAIAERRIAEAQLQMRLPLGGEHG